MALPNDIRNSVNAQGQNVLVTGQRFKRFDQIRQRHFWSTYRFVPDANGYIRSGQFDIFQTPSGQQGQGYSRQLSAQETNWPSSNRVPDNQNFEITELGCTVMASFQTQDQSGNIVDSPIKADWPNFPAAQAILLDNTSLAITYLTNTVPLGMCSDFAQASGPQMGFYAPNAPQTYPLPAGPYENAAVDATRTFYTNGFAAPGLRRRFKIPILLQHGETFRFTLQIEAGRGPFMSPISAATTVDELPTLVYDMRVDFWATESFVENS
jgi:hypothetical protein